MRLTHSDDVICALATGPGRSPIGVVRVSGRESEKVVRKLADFLPNKIESHRSYYGLLRDPIKGSVLDEAMATYFQEGRSYSGECSFEISCHGNPIILSLVLKTLIASGARLAKPGEFTLRAFLNGRIDLTEAEAVHQLIQAESTSAVRASHRQLEGFLGAELKRINTDLYGVLAQVEAGIDFSTEGLELWKEGELLQKITAIRTSVERLLETFSIAKKQFEGMVIALVGPPNVGKSSLMNILMSSETSIVDASPGTTRDAVSDTLEIDGVKIRIFDTAGLRDTSDRVEAIGIRKSYEIMTSADVIFGVFDLSRPETLTFLQDEMRSFAKGSWLVLGNKSDLVVDPKEVVNPEVLSAKMVEAKISLKAAFPAQVQDAEFISCQEVELTQKTLFGFLKNHVLPNQISESPLISNSRQYDNLFEAERSLARALETLTNHAGTEFISVDLTTAALKIDEILGNQVDEAIIDRIFKDFCLGK